MLTDPGGESRRSCTLGLWWKDARQFWPIWVVLLLAAAATQWLMLILVGRPVRFGGLGVSALLWAGLYALAAGAAAFAGERETGTLQAARRLARRSAGRLGGQVLVRARDDPGPDSRASGHGGVSTESWNPQHPLTPSHAVGLCMFVLVALGWGLFWSSILKSALDVRPGGDVLRRIDADASLFGDVIRF